MTEPSPHERTPSTPRQRGARQVAAAGSAGALVGLALTAVYVLRRPPCPPNYVRLIDAGLVLLVLLGALLAAELAVLLVARQPGRHPVAAVIGSILGLAVVLLLVAVLALLVQTSGSASVDSRCWTF